MYFAQEFSIVLLVTSVIKVPSYTTGVLGELTLKNPSTSTGSRRNPTDPYVLKSLTPREDEVIAMLMTAASNRDIALEFNISEETVKRHLSNIFDKLGVFTRLELVTKLSQRHIDKEIADGKIAYEAEMSKTVEVLRLDNARLTTQVGMLNRELQHVRGGTMIPKRSTAASRYATA